MKESTLKILTPLLNFLRNYDVLHETRGSKFLLRERDFIHFHDESDGLWADVKLSRGRIRVSVSTASGQGELVEMIAKKLESLEPRGEPDWKQKGRRSAR